MSEVRNNRPNLDDQQAAVLCGSMFAVV